jgi:hypothetical protein
MPRAAGSKSPELVGNLLERARDTTRRAAGRAVDADAWRRAVGPRIAERATPAGLKQGVLSVEVASSVWAQELSFLERELVTRLAGVGVQVSALRFYVRQSARRGPVEPAAPRKPAPPPRPLPADLKARLSAVDDPELRAAIAEAAGLWLAKQERAALTSPKRPARAPRSDVAGSDRPDRAGSPSNAASRRSSGGGRGSGR